MLKVTSDFNTLGFVITVRMWLL